MVFASETVARTTEGFEAQFGGDHLAHFLLVSLLYPRLQQAAATGAKVRVVAVSSAVQAMSPGIRWDDPNFELRPEEYRESDPFLAIRLPVKPIPLSSVTERYQGYGQAKLANIIFAQELTRRGANEGIIAYSLHPGSMCPRRFILSSRFHLTFYHKQSIQMEPSKFPKLTL